MHNSIRQTKQATLKQAKRTVSMYTTVMPNLFC